MILKERAGDVVDDSCPVLSWEECVDEEHEDNKDKHYNKKMADFHSLELITCYNSEEMFHEWMAVTKAHCDP